MRCQAARNPAVVDKVTEIANWLQKIDDPRVAFERELREAELRNDPGVSNLLQQALTRYQHPVYAEKLGDVRTLTAIYCAKLHAGGNLSLHDVMRPTAAERLDALYCAGKMDHSAIRKYHAALKSRADELRGGGVTKIEEHVQELDQRIAWLEQREPWLREPDTK